MTGFHAFKEIAILSLALIGLGFFWLWLIANVIVWLITRYHDRRHAK